MTEKYPPIFVYIVLYFASTSTAVMVRQRPLLDHEREKGEFEALVVVGDSTIIVAEANLNAKGSNHVLKNHHFHFSRVFGPAAGNAEVYKESLGTEVEKLEPGSLFTFMAFGQVSKRT